jgi:hypothetical protein
MVVSENALWLKAAKSFVVGGQLCVSNRTHCTVFSPY